MCTNSWTGFKANFEQLNWTCDCCITVSSHHKFVTHACYLFLFFKLWGFLVSAGLSSLLLYIFFILNIVVTRNVFCDINIHPQTCAHRYERNLFWVSEQTHKTLSVQQESYLHDSENAWEVSKQGHYHLQFQHMGFPLAPNSFTIIHT